MEKASNGFVRADQIDLKSLDEQLERHLNRALTLEKSRKSQDDFSLPSFSASTAAVVRRPRQEWEIDPSKLIIKSVLARGTFGTVHRGIYDGQDVAGQSPTLFNQQIPLFYESFKDANFLSSLSLLPPWLCKSDLIHMKIIKNQIFLCQRLDGLMLIVKEWSGDASEHLILVQN